MSVDAASWPDWNDASDPYPDEPRTADWYFQVCDLPPAKPVRWIAEGLVPSSDLTLLVASPKVGKSTFARYLAACVASGRRCLNRSVEQRPVLYIAAEDQQDPVTLHFERLGAAGPDVPLYLTPRRSAKGLTAEKLGDAIRIEGFGLVVVDTLQTVFPLSDGNDYGKTVADIKRLIDVAAETGCAIIATHHFNKGNGNGGAFIAPSHRIMGSQAIFGTIAQAIYLERNEDRMTMRAEGRYGEVPATTLHYDPATGTFDVGLPVRERVQEEARSLIVGRLDEAGEEGLPKSDLDKGRGSQEALKRMIDAGTAEEYDHKDGKGGRPKKYVRLLPQGGLA